MDSTKKPEIDIHPLYNLKAPKIQKLGCEIKYSSIDVRDQLNYFINKENRI